MHFKEEPIKDDSNDEQDFSAFMNLLLKIQYYLKTFFFFSCRYSREQHKKKKNLKTWLGRQRLQGRVRRVTLTYFSVGGNFI